MRNVTTSTSGLQNEPLIYKGSRSDGSKYQIEEYGLYLLLPFEYNTEQVKDAIKLFGNHESNSSWCWACIGMALTGLVVCGL
jgi:hypothetical protein